MAKAETAEKLWKQGLEESLRQHYPQAIDKYKQAIELDHGFARGYQSWADSLRYVDDPDTALAELQHSIEQYFDQATGHLIVGNAYLDLGYYDKALAALQKAIALDGTLIEAYLNAGEAARGLSQFDTAISYYQQALAQDPGSALAYVKWGNALAYKQDYAAAIEKFKQALVLDPGNKAAIEFWSYAVAGLEQPDAALAELRQRIDQDFATDDGYILLGNTLHNLGKFAEAAEIYEKVIALNPNHSEVFISCGDAYAKIGEYDKAFDCYQRSIKLNPSDYVAYLNWGTELEQRNDFAGAIEKYKQAINNNPANDFLLNNWAQAIEMTPDVDTAIADFRAVIESKFATVDGYTRLGTLLQRLKKFPEALAAFQHVIDLQPDDSAGYLDKAEVYVELNDFHAAIEYYQQAHRHDPTGTYIFTSWAEAIRKSDRPDAELKAFRDAIKNDLPTAEGYNNLGILLKNLKHYKQAIEACQHAIELDPAYIYGYLDCALVYVELEDYAAALALYKQAHQVNPADNNVIEDWAKVILKLPDPDPEIAALRAAIDKNAPTARNYDCLGRLFLKLMRNRDALSVWQLAVSKGPVDDYIHYNLGIALEQNGDEAGAIQAYNDALKVNSHYALAYNKLGRLYALSGDEAKAMAHIKKAIENNPYDVGNYFEWLNIINVADEAKADAELAEFKSKALASLNKGEANRLIAILLHTRFRQLEEARNYFNQAVLADPNRSEIYYNLANLLADMYLYAESLENYQLAIKVYEQNRETEQVYYSYYYHNYASTLQTMGRFKDARKKWYETVKTYIDYLQDKENPTDSWFYFYYGSICQELFKDYRSAEEAYQRSLSLQPDNHITQIALAKLYLEHRENTLSDSDEDRMTRNYCHFHAWAAYRQAENLITRRSNFIHDKDAMLDLVDLYIAFAKYDEAKQYLEKILSLHPDNRKAIQGAGVVALKQENYTEAVKYFVTARADDQDNLDIRANLARAYQQLKRNDEAEKIYKEILITARFHVDSLIGLSEIYIAEAENANTKGNAGDAAVSLSKAINELKKLLDYTDMPEVHLPDVPQRVLEAPLSRPLSQKEISSIYYLLGYANTKLFDAKKITNTDLLKQAEDCFNKVKYGTPNYFKAERASGKVQELMAKLTKSGTGVSTMIVSVLALFLFCVTQFGFFIGRPIIGHTELSVNPAALAIYLKSHKVDTQKHQTEIAGLTSSRFVMEQEIAAAINALLGKEQIKPEQLNALIQHSGDLRLKGFEKMGDVSYTLLSFGSLIFIVAGMFLREITKLKFGAVELEKASMDQVAVTPTLNITL